MMESLTVSPSVQAALLLTVVLVEAVVLYVGYGYVERLVATRLLDSIGNA